MLKVQQRFKAMYEYFPNTLWRKVMVVVFITCTILLTLSYYDYSKLIHYQILSAQINGVNLSGESNTTDLWDLFDVAQQNSFTEESTGWNYFGESEEASSATSLRIFTNASTDQYIANLNSSQDEQKYLVSSSKCKIVNLDPFSEDAKKYFKPIKYKSCSKKKLLTYVKKQDNVAVVYIDKKLIPQYTKKTLSCCYSDVSRSTSSKNPDDSIKVTPCKNFQHNVTLTKDAILITCTEKGSKKKLYENVHTSVRVTEDVQKKINNFDNTSDKPVSLLFVGIDSISRLNFIRSMPETYKFVEKNGWIPLKGYNKIDDNTFPNLMAILTGYNQTTAYKLCNPRAVGFLDKCSMLWYDYRNLGYITGYAEDEPSISTFNYNKKGFIKPPADYYFRPYIMATDKLSSVVFNYMNYCTGPETAGERIMNVIKDFEMTFLNYSHFGFFWMNAFSHNELNAPSRMDNKVKLFLTDLVDSGVTNNTIVVFLSDHGMRFGDIRLTETGWLEERLPYIYFSFPPSFKKKFSREFSNFKTNINKLTVPYDIYMTLQHILTLSGFNHTMKLSDACPKCMSLFENIPADRSCEEAGIVEHWCTCAGYIEKKLDSDINKKLADFVIGEMQKIINKKGGNSKCAKYSLDKISTRVSEKFLYKNATYVLVNLKTRPKAMFETTVKFLGDIRDGNYEMGDVSRLDYYSSHSHCVSDSYLKKYCYCR